MPRGVKQQATGGVKRIAIAFDQKTAQELDRIAKQEGTSISSLVAGMVGLWLKE